jgi:hypothetical protein
MRTRFDTGIFEPELAKLMRTALLAACQSACNFGSDAYVERPDRQGVCGGLIQPRRCSHMSGLLMRTCDRWP